MTSCHFNISNSVNSANTLIFKLQGSTGIVEHYQFGSHTPLARTSQRKRIYWGQSKRKCFSLLTEEGDGGSEELELWLQYYNDNASHCPQFMCDQ